MIFFVVVVVFGLSRVLSCSKETFSLFSVSAFAATRSPDALADGTDVAWKDPGAVELAFPHYVNPSDLFCLVVIILLYYSFVYLIWLNISRRLLKAVLDMRKPDMSRSVAQ